MMRIVAILVWKVVFILVSNRIGFALSLLRFFSLSLPREDHPHGASSPQDCTFDHTEGCTLLDREELGLLSLYANRVLKLVLWETFQTDC